MSAPTQKQIEDFLELISAGESVKKSSYSVGCTEKDFYRLSSKDASFDADLSRARAKGQDALVDEMKELAESCDESNVNSTKLKIWAAQWIAAKRAPRKYGERVELDSKVQYDASPTLLDIIRKSKGLPEPVDELEA